MPESDVLSPATFARFASELQSQSGAALTASAAVEQLKSWVEQAHAVSLTERSGKQWRTRAATDALAEEADRLQYELDEGPCRDAAITTTPLRSGDVASDPRWPGWGPGAARRGVASLLSIPVRDTSGPASALNVYSRDHGAFHDRDLVDQCEVHAVHVAHALSCARATDDLHTALTSRHVIGMAQGMVMERFGLDQQRAFDLLRRLSTSTNTKLRDVAARLVETGTLP